MAAWLWRMRWWCGCDDGGGAGCDDGGGAGERAADMIAPRFVCLWLFFAYALLTSFRPLTGKKGENPLVLLGQYNDDELADGSSGEQNKAEDSGIMPDDDEEKLTAGQGSENLGTKEGNGHIADKVGQLGIENGPALMDSFEKLEEDAGAGIHTSGTGVLHDANGLTEEVPAASTSYTQVGRDVSTGWKIVLHEESNQYYYWNIATGETSWEVPSVLAWATELRSNAAENEQKQKDVSKATNQNGNSTEVSVHEPMTEILNAGNGGDTLDDKKANHGGDVLDDLGTSPGKNVSPRQSDDVLAVGGNATNNNLLEHEHKGCYEIGTDLSSHLMKQCENLLEQWNIVKGYASS